MTDKETRTETWRGWWSLTSVKAATWKRPMWSHVVRLTLAAALLYVAYQETGVATVGILTMLLLRTEIEDWKRENP